MEVDMGVGRRWQIWLTGLLIGNSLLACAPEGAPTLKVNPRDDAAMVYLPAGKFLMGDDNETIYIAGSARQVSLEAFWIYQTPVTNSQYRRCIAAGGCQGDLADYPDNDYPATGVTWRQARDYCAWAGGRLPTEAEWEKAARGTDGRRYPWGNDEPTCALANYADCQAGLMPVGRYPAGASPYGVLDLAGNVWEWVEDQYQGESHAPAPGDEDDDNDHAIYDWRILRGGSRFSGAAELQSWRRNWARAEAATTLYGFRCAFDETP